MPSDAVWNHLIDAVVYLIAPVILAVCAVFILIGVLLGLAGHPVVRW